MSSCLVYISHEFGFNGGLVIGIESSEPAQSHSAIEKSFQILRPKLISLSPIN